METLYDLLGALPNDDAEGLRAAFRRAVKGAHPDIRPGDPDAALKFREIVRANEILGDVEQRAAYDELLELARLERDQESKYAVAARIHKLASGVIALSGASLVTVGGYLLFMHMSAASIAPANILDLARALPEIVAAVSPAASPDVPGEANAPTSATQDTHAERVLVAKTGPSTNLAESEASHPRARGISVAANGDQTGSTAGQDPAHKPDPRFRPAYGDRGIILYGLHKFERAFADTAPARRIGRPSHPKPPLAMARKPHFDPAAIPPWLTPAFRQQTAAHDPSREESVVIMR
jgi:curved DNA-binding protein CbpA